MNEELLIGRTKLTYNRKIVNRLSSKQSGVITANDLSVTPRTDLAQNIGEALNEVFNCLDLGMSLKTACDYAGINVKVIDAIRIRATQNPTLEPYATIVKQIKFHMAKFERDRLEVITQADDYRAHLDLLKLRRSEDYTVNVKHDYNFRLIAELKDMLAADIIDADYIIENYPDVAEKMHLGSGSLSKQVDEADYIIK